MEMHWKNRGFGNYDGYYKGSLRGRISSVYGRRGRGWRVLFPDDRTVTYHTTKLNEAKDLIASHVKHTEKLKNDK
jgi:hypothetical protein